MKFKNSTHFNDLQLLLQWPAVDSCSQHGWDREFIALGNFVCYPHSVGTGKRPHHGLYAYIWNNRRLSSIFCSTKLTYHRKTLVFGSLKTHHGTKKIQHGPNWKEYRSQSKLASELGCKSDQKLHRNEARMNILLWKDKTELSYFWLQILSRLDRKRRAISD